MSRLNTIIFLLVLLLSTCNKTFSQYEVFENGEELSYDVYYSFINIGTVSFSTVKTQDINKNYRCKAIMKSSDLMSFAKVDYEFISDIMFYKEEPVPFYSLALENVKHGKLVQTYLFNYDSLLVHLFKTGISNETIFDKNIPLNTNYQDGLTIFYFARFSSFKNHESKVPVIINQDPASVDIKYNIKPVEVEIDRIDYPVSTIYVEGYSNFVAVFGLTGEFSGWFSNDNFRVPIKAKLKVQIGNITLELKSWKKLNWNPPKY
jgi:hypothetical protein